MPPDKLIKLIDFYQTLTPESVARFGEFYAETAWFKDPFNEVRGLPAIQRIFAHMFSQVGEPRFVVTEKVGAGGTAVGDPQVPSAHFKSSITSQRALIRLLQDFSRLTAPAITLVAVTDIPPHATTHVETETPVHAASTPSVAIALTSPIAIAVPIGGAVAVVAWGRCVAIRTRLTVILHRLLRHLLSKSQAADNNGHKGRNYFERRFHSSYPSYPIF